MDCGLNSDQIWFFVPSLTGVDRALVPGKGVSKDNRNENMFIPFFCVWHRFRIMLKDLVLFFDQKGGWPPVLDFWKIWVVEFSSGGYKNQQTQKKSLKFENWCNVERVKKYQNLIFKVNFLRQMFGSFHFGIFVFSYFGYFSCVIFFTMCSDCFFVLPVLSCKLYKRLCNIFVFS